MYTAFLAYFLFKVQPCWFGLQWRPCFASFMISSSSVMSLELASLPNVMGMASLLISSCESQENSQTLRSNEEICVSKLNFLLSQLSSLIYWLEMWNNFIIFVHRRAEKNFSHLKKREANKFQQITEIRNCHYSQKCHPKTCYPKHLIIAYIPFHCYLSLIISSKRSKLHCLPMPEWVQG